MRVVELFAGIGGFRLGLERAGHEVVWANEWDKQACDTYDKNFKDKGHLIDRRDLTIIPAGDIPAHDLIVGGFPCQAFSIAGKRLGFEETRGTLFFEILRIARHHRTPYLFLENVKGLLNHDGGRTFDTIIRALDESGYDCGWQVLNSKHFGVPQNRERIFIICHLRGVTRPEVFPLGSSTETSFELPGQQSNTLTTRYYGGQANGTYVIERQLNAQIRRLTPIECERLQGFPDNWTSEANEPQRYKQLGNAVTVNVIEAIARRLPLTVT